MNLVAVSTLPAWHHFDPRLRLHAAVQVHASVHYYRSSMPNTFSSHQIRR
jgi:hypothetical protein